MSIYNSSLGIIKIGEIIKRCLEGCGRVHMIGVLGVGQRGIAEMLLAQGVAVSGSDIGDGAEELIKRGLCFFNSHSEDNVKGASLVVYTLAISEDNPEYSYARKNGIPTASRAELAAYLLSLCERSICVAGSHGKSTVTALLAHIFRFAGKEPSVLLGAELEKGRFSEVGGGELFVAEACEYKDSFLKFRPSIAIVNNVELDHTDYFSSLAALKRSFVKYASHASELVLLNTDDAGALSIKNEVSARVLTYGSASDCDYRMTNVAVGVGECIFSLSKNGRELGEFRLHLAGSFNAENAVAAIAAAYECGVDIELIRGGVSSFKGVARRLEYIGSYKSRPVFYDYAHHPTEIRGGISALRTLGADVLTVVFKSHTYTRTAALWDDFVRALSLADFAVIGDIYGAREKNESGISPVKLARDIGEGAIYSSDDEITKALDNLTRGAIVLMGAADMTGILERMNLKK